MKFDQMCSIILSEAKQKEKKFEKLIIGNANPMFSAEDILKDPTDPSKGSKLYLAAKEEKEKGLQPGAEQSTRRQLRRLNWIAKTIIKKFQNREAAFNIDDMSKVIVELLERYQTKVLGKEAPDRANTGYEARVIGNLLLPPTKRNPNGKSVLIVPGMDPNAGVEDSTKPIVQKKRDKVTNKVVKGETVTAVDLWVRYNELVDVLDELLDPDLTQTIKEIIAQGKKASEKPPVEEPPVEEPATTPAESPVGEAVEGEVVSGSGVTLKDILRDDRINNIFTPKAVKEVLKGLIKSGAVKHNVDGTLTLISDVRGGPLGSSIREYGALKKAEKEELEQEPEEIEEPEKEDLSYEKPKPGEEDVVDVPEKKPDWYGDERLDEPDAIPKSEEEKEEPKEKSEEEKEKEEEEEALKRYGFKK